MRNLVALIFTAPLSRCLNDFFWHETAFVCSADEDSLRLNAYPVHY